MNDYNRESFRTLIMGESPLDLIDRLVTDELDESTRREVLAWCERQPGGWKRCAMAFLEAQAWGQALALPIDREGSEPTAAKRETNGHSSTFRGPEWALRAPAAQAASSSQEKNSHRWRVGPATLAALVLAGIALGAVVGRVSNARFDPHPIAAPDQKENERGSSSTKEAAPDRGDDPGDVAPPARGHEAPGPLVATVSLGGGRGESRPGITMQLPIAESGNASLAESAPPASVPEHISRQWARRGWRVEPERKYLPANLPDGSRVLVPIDRMRMKYEGREVY